MTDRRRVLTVVASVALVGGLAVAVARTWGSVQHDLSRLDVGSAVGAALALLAGLVGSLLGWRALLHGLGSDLPVPAAARVFFVGQLGKYVPGSLWPVLAQMEMGKALGVPRARMGAASLIAVLLSVATGLLAGLVTGSQLPGISLPAGVLALIAAVPLVVLLVRPQLVSWGLRLLQRAIRRPSEEGEVAAGAMRAAIGWAVVTTGCNGVHAWLLARSLGAHGPHLLLVVTGAFALAQTGGILAILVPAGAAVREGLLVGLLAGVMSGPAALALALVSRLLVILTDGLAAGLALLGARRSS